VKLINKAATVFGKPAVHAFATQQTTPILHIQSPHMERNVLAFTGITTTRAIANESGGISLSTKQPTRWRAALVAGQSRRMLQSALHLEDTVPLLLPIDFTFA
jgi:hypothetical protein